MEIQIRNQTDHVLARAQGTDSCVLTYDREYEEGDRIVITVDRPRAVYLSLDETLPGSGLWFKKDTFTYVIPFGEARTAYAERAFAGNRHTIESHYVNQEEWQQYRNISVNPLDQRGPVDACPHCTASVETRGESVFAARNTIDGHYENTCHGEWPYTSWGDNEDPQASITIDFGGKVWTDRIDICLRADFPHDNYWHSMKLLFSDGSYEMLHLEKTGEVQQFHYDRRVTNTVTLCNLLKDETDPSPFPALTQWAVYGCRIED